MNNDDNFQKLNTSINTLLEKFDYNKCNGEDCLQFNKVKTKLSIFQTIGLSFIGILIIIATWSYFQFLDFSEKYQKNNTIIVTSIERINKDIENINKNIKYITLSFTKDIDKIENDIQITNLLVRKNELNIVKYLKD